MKNKVLLPILLAIVAVAGILTGYTLQLAADDPAAAGGPGTSSVYEGQAGNAPFSKLNEVISYVNYYYVDPVDEDAITEAMIPELLSQLDPHTVYIPQEDVEVTNSELEGTFSGIGVQFSIQNDTIMIVDVIAGGPSEKAGLQPGDRIVEVADTSFTGKWINNNKVLKTLRGAKGTRVKLGVRRMGSDELLHYTITRGDIPVNSVDIAYPITPRTGYVKVSQFGANTYNEFRVALTDLRRKGCDSYIIDLRSNSGGYLSAAISMLNEFLPKGQLIVYTEGRNYSREEARATGGGGFTDAPVVVLINEWSASASEIFAGAIQDQDRGWIVGRRSYGKGLVQQQMPLSDGSEIRVTIARYHTPSGRCIQKSYEKGDLDNYESDIETRYEHGEFFHQDSIHLADSLRYSTRGGRTVYGGGGIMPDYFVPQDTTGSNAWYRAVSNRSLIYEFAFSYADRNRQRLMRLGDYKSLVNYLAGTSLTAEFRAYAAGKGFTATDAQFAESTDALRRNLHACISRNLFGDDGFYPLLNEDDPTVQKALEVIQTPMP